MTNKKNKITIFLFHEISDNPSVFCKDYYLNVSPKVFKKQIRWIKNNFTIISPKLLIKDLNNIPKNPALITFDDGFLGAFDNGLKYLIKNKIPSLMFLNMEHIINNTPLISSKAIYYQKFCSEIDVNLKTQLHLNVNPNKLIRIENRISRNLDSKILEYQGKLANYQTVNHFSKNKYIFYGNHLYSHWNSPALTDDDFIFNLKKNREFLKKYKNYCDIFAFPNGMFNKKNIINLKKTSFIKAFSSSGNINSNFHDFLLDRISLTEFEYNNIKLYIRLMKSKSKNFILNKFLGFLRKI